jgi:hypothetical protein
MSRWSIGAAGNVKATAPGKRGGFSSRDEGLLRAGARAQAAFSFSLAQSGFVSPDFDTLFAIEEPRRVCD